MKFHCSYCQQRLECDESMIGQEVQCVKCLQNIAVPAPDQPINSQLENLVEQAEQAPRQGTRSGRSNVKKMTAPRGRRTTKKSSSSNVGIIIVTCLAVVGLAVFFLIGKPKNDASPQVNGVPIVIKPSLPREVLADLDSRGIKDDKIVNYIAAKKLDSFKAKRTLPKRNLSTSIFLESSLQGLPESTPLLPDNVLARYANVKNKKLLFSGKKIEGKFLLEMKETEVKNFFSSSLRIPLNKNVKKGESLLIAFHARSLLKEAVYAEISMSSKGEKDPHLKENLVFHKEWQRILIPLNLDKELNKAAVTIKFGGQGAHWQMADLHIVQLKEKSKYYKMKKYRYPYKGFDKVQLEKLSADIQRHRQGYVVLECQDKTGQALKNLPVEVQLKKHQFPFGTAIAAEMFPDFNSKNRREKAKFDDARRYQDAFKNLFNSAVFENSMKWKSISNKNRLNPAIDRAIKSMEAEVQDYRGHVMVWPSFKKSPPYLKKLEKSPEKLKKELIDHVQWIAKQWPDIRDWDVINEAVSNHDLYDLLDDDILAQIFKEARQHVSPDCVLTINDYGTLAGFNPTHRNKYYSIIEKVLKEAAPVEQIGFQSHFSFAQEPASLIKVLDQFQNFKLPLRITEFDLPTKDENLQAHFLHDFLTLCFAREEMTGFTIWGFWDGKHWRPDSGLYAKDWRLKTGGKVWKKLLKEQWHSELKGKSNDEAMLSSRLFYGDYEAKIQTKTGVDLYAYFSLKKGEDISQIKLKFGPKRVEAKKSELKKD